MTFLQRHSSLPYVLPFLAFVGFLALYPFNPLPDRTEALLRVVALSGVLWIFSKEVISLRVSRRRGSLLLGVCVFLAWVAPDLLVPGYRDHWLFQNAITGPLRSSLTETARADSLVLGLRTFRAIILVPVIEELFWRGWMMRWLINPDFHKVALGAFTVTSFAMTALLFASEHGPYWEVGLLAGLAYNWWMIRTRSLGDCIFAHAVTNGCLCLFVLATGKWEYWL